MSKDAWCLFKGSAQWVRKLQLSKQSGEESKNYPRKCDKQFQGYPGSCLVLRREPRHVHLKIEKTRQVRKDKTGYNTVRFERKNIR